MSTESTTKLVTRYGLNTGQIVEVEETGYTDPEEIMNNINYAMSEEKFVEYATTMILCEAIISVEVFEKNSDN